MHADDLSFIACWTYKLLGSLKPPEKVEVGELLREGDAVRWGATKSAGAAHAGATRKERVSL